MQLPARLVALAFLMALTSGAMALEAEQQTTATKRLFTYVGPLLPSDWSLVSIINERVVIGFNNGSARNSLLTELEPKDRAFIQRLQNGTVYSTPLSSAKEKLAQWSSQVTSTVSKFGKSVKDQFDQFINNNKTAPTTTTLSPLIISN